ncbi:hypothetical protein PLUTE_b0432 [Pseudoalteromonas luteoviolacea DSM 6061]|nr:hypothetical protein [Pseudoalteromonas luteoviolacea DSM 6061]MBE0389466.1 hypothetical protein [Pseudoalteromonas luteoviolacea DSM 6061]
MTPNFIYTTNAPLLTSKQKQITQTCWISFYLPQALLKFGLSKGF